MATRGLLTEDLLGPMEKRILDTAAPKPGLIIDDLVLAKVTSSEQAVSAAPLV